MVVLPSNLDKAVLHKNNLLEFSILVLSFEPVQE